jgi:hypothetical protein
MPQFREQRMQAVGSQWLVVAVELIATPDISPVQSERNGEAVLQLTFGRNIPNALR